MTSGFSIFSLGRKLEPPDLLVHEGEVHLAEADVPEVFSAVRVVGFRGEEEVIVLLEHQRLHSGRREQAGELDGNLGLPGARFAGDGDRAPVVVDPFPQQVEDGLRGGGMVGPGYDDVSDHGVNSLGGRGP